MRTIQKQVQKKTQSLKHRGYDKHLFDKEEVPELIKLQKKTKKEDEKNKDVFWIIWQKEHTVG